MMYVLPNSYIQTAFKLRLNLSSVIEAYTAGQSNLFPKQFVVSG